MEKYTVEGYWDCHYCSSKGIRGRHRECPNCGRPRGEETKFYLKEFGEEYAVDESPERPDWLCGYCSTYNPDAAKECLSCNAPRDGKTYAEIRGLEKSVVKDKDKNSIDDEGEISNEEREKQNLRQDAEDREKKRREASQKWREKDQQHPRSSSPKQNFFHRHRVLLSLGAVFIVAAIAALCYAFLPKHVSFEVTDLSWERSISIQERYTAEESGWDVPSGGRVKFTKEELHHTEEVFDHNETYYEDVSEEVLDHYKTETHKIDKGNGFFDIEKEQVPVYKTVHKKVKKERPVYRDVPVYKTKYYYLIERWKTTRSVDTSAHDKEPVWGDVSLADGEGPYDVGQERASKWDTTFRVSGIANGEKVSYVVDDTEFWESMSVGDTVSGKTTSEGKFYRDE